LSKYQADNHGNHVAPCLILDTQEKLYENIDSKGYCEESITAQRWNVIETCHGQVASLQCAQARIYEQRAIAIIVRDDGWVDTGEAIPIWVRITGILTVSHIGIGIGIDIDNDINSKEEKESLCWGKTGEVGKYILLISARWAMCSAGPHIVDFF
jgi:hypothetical protein